jgi:surface polysaccharide O-acyltransferase-like enzyme
MVAAPDHDGQSQNQEETSLRKHYIDNLRWLCSFMLIPYHTCMIFNSFGEDFYVRGPAVAAASGFMVATFAWYMPLLFAIAGASSAFALVKRTPSQYVKERLAKLLLPFVSGVVLLNPAQTYFAERFHNGYQGGYLEQYGLFFTKVTGFFDYSGGFTPAQLWFILYLFIISLLALPIMVTLAKSDRKPDFGGIPIWALLLLFVVPFAAMPILDFGGKSLGKYFTYFMFGYLFLSQDALVERLTRARWRLFAASLALMAVHVWYWLSAFDGMAALPTLLTDLYGQLFGWLTTLTAIGLGSRYFNQRNAATDYLSSASFPVYILHQSILVGLAFYVLRLNVDAPLKMALIICGSTAMTYAAYELVRRTPGLRLLFAIKPPAKAQGDPA